MVISTEERNRIFPNIFSCVSIVGEIGMKFGSYTAVLLFIESRPVPKQSFSERECTFYVALASTI